MCDFELPFPVRYESDVAAAFRGVRQLDQPRRMWSSLDNWIDREDRHDT